jgi:hypothetical protein
VQAAVKKEYFADQLKVVPRDGDKVNVDGAELTWHAFDTTNYNVNLFHFARAYGKKTSDVLFWVVTVINSPREMRDVRLGNRLECRIGVVGQRQRGRRDLW